MNTSAQSEKPRHLERFATIVAAIACVWFGLAAAWGMFGTIGAGHIGGGASGTAMMAEQMVRWKIGYPAWDWYGSAPPSPDAYYCHHPFGMYWLSAFFLWIFGHRDFVVILPAVLVNAAIPPLLYSIGKQHWGVIAGSAAACAYTVIPIAVGFASFHNLEGLCILGALLCFWGHSKFQATAKGQYLAASLLGIAIATCGDWVGFLLVAPLLAWAFLRLAVLPAWASPPLKVARYARWAFLSAALALAILAMWIFLFQRVGKIADWLGSGAIRGGGDELKLSDVLIARKHWLDFSFTPFAILVGKIALPLAVLRLIVKRTDEEIYSLALLFGAAVQYVVFKRGADVHIFWPHYFAAYYALAIGQLSATVCTMARWLTARWNVRVSNRAGALSGLVVGLVPSLLMVPDAVRAKRLWAQTGGRYNDNGGLIRSDIDLFVVVKQIVYPKVSTGAVADIQFAGLSWEHQWALHGKARPDRGEPLHDDPINHPIWYTRASGVDPDTLQRIAGNNHVRVYGDVWVVTQGEPQAPLDAHALREREPNLLEWYLVSGVEPVRTAMRKVDPFLTWEWRTHLGQEAPFPTTAPASINEIRIAHNAAIARRDVGEALRLRTQVESQLDRSVATDFDGVRLLGVRLTGGVQPRIETWFEVSDHIEAHATFNVRSVVESQNRLSLIPPDPTERELAWPPSLSPRLWKKGYLYKTETVMNHRIGGERYFGYWTARDSHPAPKRSDGRASTDLVFFK